jgi:hypothetical protein
MYTRWTKPPIADIIKAIPDVERNAFYDLASTIGGYIVFPANKIDRKPTINGIRGMHPLLKDRFDFALECIRRWYQGVENPLTIHIDRYKDFFKLFEDFQGYYKFFLLYDLVNEDTGEILFWLPFIDFGKTKPLPESVAEYREYMKNATNFVKARNLRIMKYVNLQKSIKHIEDNFT